MSLLSFTVSVMTLPRSRQCPYYRATQERIAAALINALHRLVESRQESCEAKERLAGENPRR